MKLKTFESFVNENFTKKKEEDIKRALTLELKDGMGKELPIEKEVYTPVGGSKVLLTDILRYKIQSMGNQVPDIYIDSGSLIVNNREVTRILPNDNNYTISDIIDIILKNS